ncbi:MAG: metallophosphoesterase [Planctomycetota bacterium]
MKLALIGDIHLFTLRVHPKRLLSRRVMAQSNLWLNRRHRFNHALLPDLVERVKGLSPEAVLYSGDVTTSSLESEFEEVLKVVGPLEEAFPGAGVLVPGNHDRYTFKSRRVRRIDEILSAVVPPTFPHVRPLKPGWTLLALDSAIPNRFFSRGALGKKQYDAAVETIRAVPEDEGLVVLCHYPCSLPPRVPSAWSHDLKEANALRRELVACPGRVVYLHGHIHKPWHTLADPAVAAGDETVKGPARFAAGTAFECINAGSPCMTSEKYPLGQGFWEVTLPDDPAALLEALHHVPVAPDGTDPPAGGASGGGVAWRVGPAL